MLLALEGELVVVDMDGIDELRRLMAQRDEEDLQSLQVIGRYPPVDAVLVTASAGGNQEGRQGEEENQCFFRGVTVAWTRWSENSSRYTPRVSKRTRAWVKSGAL